MTIHHFLPAGPLVAAVEAHGGTARLVERGHHSPAAVERLTRAYRRARTRGHITAEAADALCVELLGEHPVLVWGDQWLLPEHRSGAEGPTPAAPASGDTPPAARAASVAPVSPAGTVDPTQ